jgi:predicted transcriptional regulator
MSTFTIELPEEQARRLRELAQEAGIPPERLLRAGLEEWLSRPNTKFAEAADYVLSKNRELYRRLA